MINDSYNEKLIAVDTLAQENKKSIEDTATKQIEDTIIGGKLIAKDIESKQSIIKNYCNEVQAILPKFEQGLSISIAKICDDFVKEYSISVFPTDDKDHNAELNTAVTMINSLGDQLDADTLKNLIQPLRYDKKSFNLVKKLVMAKDFIYKRVGVNLENVFDEVVGVGGYFDVISDYENTISIIDDMAHAENSKPYTITVKPINNDLEVCVTITKSYNLLSLPRLMNDIMSRYDYIRKTIPGLHLMEKPQEKIYDMLEV